MTEHDVLVGFRLRLFTLAEDPSRAFSLRVRSRGYPASCPGKWDQHTHPNRSNRRAARRVAQGDVGNASDRLRA